MGIYECRAEAKARHQALCLGSREFENPNAPQYRPASDYRARPRPTGPCDVKSIFSAAPSTLDNTHTVVGHYPILHIDIERTRLDYLMLSSLRY